jgi:hypothetical protein
MLSLLLSDGAARAKQIVSDFKPQFTKNEFLAHQNSIFSDGDRIVYSEDGATVKI